jgi:hypothetical protein
MFVTQLEATPTIVHCADHPETMKRCCGKLHEAFGWNM